MNRYSLDRNAGAGERALGAGAVLVLAFFVGLASYHLWKLALTTHWLDPLILLLAVTSTAGSLLLVHGLFKHLSTTPRPLSARWLTVIAGSLVASGLSAITFALLSGLHEPRLYGPAFVSIAMGLAYIRSRKRTSKR